MSDQDDDALRVEVCETRPTLTAVVVGLCALCDGAGVRHDPEAEEGSVVLCPCYEATRRAGLFNAARLPSHAFAADIRTLKAPKDPGDRDQWLNARSAMAQAVRSGTGLITMAGSAGTGKSWLICGILRWAVLGLGQAAVYANARDGFSLVAYAPEPEPRAVRPSGDRIAAAMAVLTDASVLGFDEVGHQRVPFARDIVSQVIAARVDAGRPTFIATNHSPDQISEIFDASIADRIFTGGAAFFLAGDSWRAERS